MALPTPAGYWLDPVIFLVILLLYVPSDAKLLRAKEWMLRNPAVKENWDAWTEGHRSEKDKLGFASAKDHLTSFIENDLLLAKAFKDKGVLPSSDHGSPLPPNAALDPLGAQRHVFKPNTSFILS